MQQLCRLVIFSLISSCVIFITTIQSKPISSNVEGDEKTIKDGLKKSSHEITQRIYSKDAHGNNTKIIEIDYDFFGEIIDKRVYLSSDNDTTSQEGGAYDPRKDPGMGIEISPETADISDVPETKDDKERPGISGEKRDDSGVVGGGGKIVIQPDRYTEGPIGGVPVNEPEKPTKAQLYLIYEEGDSSAGANKFIKSESPDKKMD